MSQSIVELVDNLPTDNITVKVLKTISTFTPGKWSNLVGFDNTITAVTGATSGSEISKIRDRALELYDDKKQGYQTAIWLYRTVDNTDKAIAAVAIADKIGDKFSFIELTDGKLDYLAAFLDGSTNFFEHTGIQTVARRLITEAALNS